jgi:hypothetical protein
MSSVLTANLCRFASQKTIDMKAITHPSYKPSYQTPIRLNLFAKFINWCEGEEKNRLGWLALALTSHGCIITPLVVLAIVSSGNNFILWITAMVAMGITLVVNLAAQPTKITIPTFLISILIDVAVVIACISQAVI